MNESDSHFDDRTENQLTDLAEATGWSETGVALAVYRKLASKLSDGDTDKMFASVIGDIHESALGDSDSSGVDLGDVSSSVADSLTGATNGDADNVDLYGTGIDGDPAFYSKTESDSDDPDSYGSGVDSSGGR